MPTKIRIYSTCVLAVLLYGSETWTLTQADWKWLDPFHTRCQRRILHTRWYDFVSNNEVLRRTDLLAASSIVRKRRLELCGHVARLTEDVLANQILRTCCEAQDGARPSPDTGHGNISWPTLCSWQKIARSGNKSQRRNATAERFASWWWWWVSTILQEQTPKTA